MSARHEGSTNKEGIEVSKTWLEALRQIAEMRRQAKAYDSKGGK